ncbi:protein of unknown function DUF1568 [Thioalkalivibrio sp. K90mix]|jgi:REP element-mobilizing transposase RayT|uniref:transposase n=2 Tax=unclassified Thioalkalivibrio TaxID=2621013 RepID=UPI0001C4E1EA|nr:transposase [Thioalkalivibrio sp. K90mix]ADC72304.1 protein of unknown function DUF1568 [Thioalkalivibrio sp. K90mix]
MVRPLRLEYPWALYHVTARGDRRGWIYQDSVDHQRFLDTLAQAVQRYNWVLSAYCLMGNHYHLLVETPDANLSRGMQWLNGVYTQRFNRRHRRVGHVLQGRYKAILVERESYLLELARYIVLNPVRAHLVARPSDWKWSSYTATAGQASAPTWLTTDRVLDEFGPEPSAAYQQFVAEGIGKESPWGQLHAQLYLGSEDFIERQLSHRQGEPEIEHPKAQQRPTPPPLDQLTARYPRNEAIQHAYASGGYTLKTIGDYFGLHPSRISRIAAGKAKGKV